MLILLLSYFFHEISLSLRLFDLKVMLTTRLPTNYQDEIFGLKSAGEDFFVKSLIWESENGWFVFGVF